MNTEQKLKMLQLFYAGVLADSVGNYEKFGILEEVTSKKAREQEMSAKRQLAQLGIETPEQIFGIFTEVFGCIRWEVKRDDTGNSLTATGKSCLLCGIAKKTGIAQPCSMYCINPLKGLAGALEPGYTLEAEETLWDGKECRFRLNR